MKTLYLECNTGAAGDMLMAALLELHPDPQGFLSRLDNAGIPGVKVYAQPSEKCGITGTHICVEINGTAEAAAYSICGHHHEHTHSHHKHEHTHTHTSLNDAHKLIGSLNVPQAAKEHAKAVYNIIAYAESRAHGKPIDKIHFHEVGEMDAIADIIGVCMLIDELKPDCIAASPVCTGFGSVHCAHGILPVPAPATASILSGIPAYGGSIEGELCTPTGAALLRHFVTHFGTMPVMRIEKTGYGMGTKELPAANCVRAMLGEQAEQGREAIELRCNMDDMTGEAVAFAAEQLLDSGALDVFTSPVYMKKNRPGILLTCLCRAEDREKMLSLIFRHTTTIGIREYKIERHTMQRHEVTLNTNYGTVRGKESHGFGASKIKPEYEDMAQIARKNGISLSDIKTEGI